MTTIAATEKQINKTTLRLIVDDITMIDTDAFVFYAEPGLAIGTGFGTAISVRGGPSIQKELEPMAPVATGEAVITAAGKLTANHIIHAVGPRFQEIDIEEKLLGTMASCFARAREAGIKRLAFPAMGTGFYGIPLDVCARIMVAAITAHLKGETGLEEVTICVLDRREHGPFESALA